MIPVAVVGGGITGLSAALDIRRSGLQLRLLEAGLRLGGKILTTPVAGTPVDAGPDAFVVREPTVPELCERLEMAGDLVAPTAVGARVWHDGDLVALPRRQFLGIPLDLDELAASGLVSPDGIARARLDLSTGDDRPAGDESVGSLVRRRLGDEVMGNLVAPLLGGINAGDPDELSLEAGVPALAEATAREAGLVAGVRAHLADSARAEGAPVFQTHPNGLGQVVEAIGTRLGSVVSLSMPVTGIDRIDDGWRLCTDDQPVDAQAVVLTAPAFATASMLARVAPVASSILADIEYASVVMVTFAFASDAVPEVSRHGSGFLVPHDADLTMTACSWASSKWAHLSGPLAFWRVSAGRIDDDRAMEMDDEALVEALLGDLAVTTGLAAEPVAVRITRWPRSFPQYLPGHGDRVAAIEAHLADEAPGVFVAGAALRGLGLPACVHQGRVAALAAMAWLDRRDRTPGGEP